VRTTKTVKPRTIAEVAVDLRKALGHTQQSWAHVMGWGISSAVRFENGAQPSARMLAQMLDAAHAEGLEDLAAEIQLHLNVALGGNFPVSPDQKERLFVAIARRIFQNPKRHGAFLKFAAPEVAILRAEAQLQKRHTDELHAALDAWNEREQSRRKESK
jgi:transcriptional regulator with XRE-family HTH domain